MAETLQMVFTTTQGRNTTLSVTDPDSEITALDVEAVMDSVITRNVFETTGGDIVSKVRSQIVSRDVDVLAEY
ncbi:MAG: hypothetical protein AVO34_07895 [Firmicutes bacterium ML8_F2]|nr:MAG: hypothetical protein AVO34_07895 [Firmicutes bacterium ML8_F2]